LQKETYKIIFAKFFKIKRRKVMKKGEERIIENIQKKLLK